MRVPEGALLCPVLGQVAGLHCVFAPGTHAQAGCH